MIDENQLIKNIISGDVQAFQSLVEKHQRLVAHIVFRMIPDKAEQQDLCQDIFLRAYQNLPGFLFNAKFSTWLAKIAFNSCINYLEKKKLLLYDDFVSANEPFEIINNHDVSPDISTIKNDIQQRLQHELFKIPVKYRVILTLYHLDELSYREIGEILELPDGTVKNYLFRARKHLKERLIKNYQPEDLYQ